MHEFTFSGYTCNCQFITTGTNNYSLRADYILCRRECYTDLEFRCGLFMVDRSDHAKYKCIFVRELYGKGN